MINTATNTVTANVTVGDSPTGAAITPDGTHVYVVNGDSDTVSVIATAINTVTITIGGFISPSGIAIGVASAAPSADLGVSVAESADPPPSATPAPTPAP